MAGISSIELSEQYMSRFYHNEEIIKINVQQKTLNYLLENVIKLDTNYIDIISLDVEGGELKVLQGLDLNKYKVKVFVIENVFDDINLCNYMINNGYILDKKIDYNEYYILRENLN